MARSWRRLRPFAQKNHTSWQERTLCAMLFVT